MRLLVATTRFLLAYDVATERLDVLSTGGPFYGVTWSSDGAKLALTHGGYDGPLANLEDEAMADAGFMSVGERVTGPFLNMPHQALWVDDDGIAVTNTGRNMIARVLPESLAVIQERYDRALWDRHDRSGAPGSHFNSLWFDRRHLYAVGHNFARTSFVLKLEWPSLREVQRIPMPGVSGVHNFWIDDEGRWVSCDSNTGALVEARTGERLWDSRGEGFTRGLAAAADLVFVGNSELIERAHRDFASSGVWVLDRRTLALRDYIELGRFGGVQEVRVADEPDACHHGKVLQPSALDCLGRERGEAREARLARANMQAADRMIWQSRLGGFARTDLGLVTSPGVLSLATMRAHAALRDGAVAARIRVRGHEADDHVALVLRYRGPMDSGMYAAIFRSPTPGVLVASLWVESDGWRELSGVSVPASLAEDAFGEGLAVTFAAHGQRLRLAVGATDVISVEDASLQSGAVGIRSVGASLGIADIAVVPA